MFCNLSGPYREVMNRSPEIFTPWVCGFAAESKCGMADPYGSAKPFTFQRGKPNHVSSKLKRDFQSRGTNLESIFALMTSHFF